MGGWRKSDIDLGKIKRDIRFRHHRVYSTCATTHRGNGSEPSGRSFKTKRSTLSRKKEKNCTVVEATVTGRTAIRFLRLYWIIRVWACGWSKILVDKMYVHTRLVSSDANCVSQRPEFGNYICATHHIKGNYYYSTWRAFGCIVLVCTVHTYWKEKFHPIRTIDFSCRSNTWHHTRLFHIDVKN